MATGETFDEQKPGCVICYLLDKELTRKLKDQTAPVCFTMGWQCAMHLVEAAARTGVSRISFAILAGNAMGFCPKHLAESPKVWEEVNREVPKQEVGGILHANMMKAVKGL